MDSPIKITNKYFEDLTAAKLAKIFPEKGRNPSKQELYQAIADYNSSLEIDAQKAAAPKPKGDRTARLQIQINHAFAVAKQVADGNSRKAVAAAHQTSIGRLNKLLKVAAILSKNEDIREAVDSFAISFSKLAELGIRRDGMHQLKTMVAAQTSAIEISA
jgi:hypothetical protein